MAQIGDRINYVGDGNNGTSGGVSYSGTLVRVTDPGGWGPTDINANIGGTPTIILNAPQDPMLLAYAQGGGSGTQTNGTWRIIV